VFKILKRIEICTRNEILPRRQVQNTNLSSNPWSLTVEQARTKRTKHSFGLRQVEEWNNLPEDTRSAEKLSVFRSQMKKDMYLCYKNVTGGWLGG
jgi:hypothetical protein